MVLLMAVSTSSSEAQVRVVSFSVSPSNVKLSGGSMTISGHGIAMTTLFLITIVMFNTTRLRIWWCHLSPARQRISVMARIRHSLWRLSLGCKSKFLKRIMWQHPCNEYFYLRWYWSALAESRFESSAISIFMSAKEKMFENVSLDDDLKSLLSTVCHLESKPKKSLMRMKDETGLKPVGLRNKSRAAKTN